MVFSFSIVLYWYFSKNWSHNEKGELKKSKFRINELSFNKNSTDFDIHAILFLLVPDTMQVKCTIY